MARGRVAVATNEQNLTSRSRCSPSTRLRARRSTCGGGVIQAYANIQSNSSGAGCVGAGRIQPDRRQHDRRHRRDATCRVRRRDPGPGQRVDDLRSRRELVRVARPAAEPAAPVKPRSRGDGSGRAHRRHPETARARRLPRRRRRRAPQDLQDLRRTGSPTRIGVDPLPRTLSRRPRDNDGRTAYLMPGIYWIGGGGLNRRRVAARSSRSRTRPTRTRTWPLSTWGGGVLIYNSKLPAAAARPVNHLNGSAATMKLKALNVPAGDPHDIYNDIVIFQDRTVTTAVTLNGSSSETEVSGRDLCARWPGQAQRQRRHPDRRPDHRRHVYHQRRRRDDQGPREIGVDSIIVAAGLVE